MIHITKQNQSSRRNEQGVETLTHVRCHVLTMEFHVLDIIALKLGGESLNKKLNYTYTGYCYNHVTSL